MDWVGLLQGVHVTKDWLRDLPVLAIISAATVLLLISIAMWHGGLIEKISIPALFEVKLSKPIAFRRHPWSVVNAWVVTVVVLLALWFLPIPIVPTPPLVPVVPIDDCPGMPGQTAWIYGGEFDSTTGKYILGPFAQSETAGVLQQKVPIGSWITTLDIRRTMIMDYSTTGLQQANMSPFQKGHVVTFTCKTLPAGQRLYVADMKVNGPSAKDQHVWFKVRLTPVGG